MRGWNNNYTKHFSLSSFGKTLFIPTNSRVSSWLASLQLKIKHRFEITSTIQVVVMWTWEDALT
jgi:hypothetical protein